MINEEIKELYIKAAERRIDSKAALLKQSGRRDDQIAFAVGQLEKLEETIFEVIFSNPMDAFQFVPMKPRFEPGWRSYSYRMHEKLGNARVINADSDDRPNVDTDLSKTEIPIIEFGAAYSYSVTDTEAARILDYDQVQEKARACAEAIARAHNEFALVGGSGVDGGADLGITGFYNDTNVNTATLTDADWTTVSAADAYTSVNDVIEKVITQSNGKHRPDTVLLPLFIHNYLQRTRIGTDTTETVLESLRRNNPGVSFNLAVSAGGQGSGGKDLIVAYEKNPSRVEYVSSIVYDEAAPDKKGFKYTVEARGKAAKTVVRYPLSMAYGEVTVS